MAPEKLQLSRSCKSWHVVAANGRIWPGNLAIRRALSATHANAGTITSDASVALADRAISLAMAAARSNRVTEFLKGTIEAPALSGSGGRRTGSARGKLLILEGRRPFQPQPALSHRVGPAPRPFRRFCTLRLGSPWIRWRIPRPYPAIYCHDVPRDAGFCNQTQFWQHK